MIFFGGFGFLIINFLSQLANLGDLKRSLFRKTS